MLWHTIYLGQQLWGALYSFAPHLCHPRDISHINHISRLRQYSLVLRREKRVRMRYAGGGFGFISLFHFWAVKTWFSACNSGSVNSFFFLLSTGRHSLFTAITLWVWGSQGNAQTTDFSSSRSKCKEAYHTAHIHSYWSDPFQPRAASVPGCTVWKTWCRPVLLKIRCLKWMTRVLCGIAQY